MSDDTQATIAETPDEDPRGTDADETVERYDTGASVSVDVSRGTGTRDQEKWTFKGKGRNAEEALDELETQLDDFEERLAERVRNIQPEVDGE
jgi:hypothetical protein